jgi:hypothetical protein
MLVFVVSGLLGFRVGFVSFPNWQVAVETAQVMAGLVEYPPSNPFFIYHTKLWTILHQICALLLKAGVDETTLSRIVSGLLGMLAFQSLAMIVYALSRNAALSLGAALVVVFTRTAEYGVVYPIFLMGTTHTYGALGLSAAVLAAGLLGAGCSRTGLFLLGAAPAIHPSIGVWLIAVVGLAVWTSEAARLELRPLLKYFLAGLCLTTLSLAVQLLWAGHLPGFGDQSSARYLSAFAAYWDGHRQPVNFASEGVKVGAGALVLALFGLAALRQKMSHAQALLLRVIVASGVTAFALALVTHVSPDRLPPFLLTLMPGRFLNFNAQVAVALSLGLIAIMPGAFWRALLLFYVSAGLLIGNRSMLWEWLEQHPRVLDFVPFRPSRPLQILLTVAVVMLLVTSVSNWTRRRWNRPPGVNDVRRGLARNATTALNAATVVLLAGAALLMWRRYPQVSLNDRKNDIVFAAASRTEGLLLTGGDLQLVQLRTRRPVLLDGGGLDGLPYASESGREVERILHDVYGIDLFDPPDEARGRGAIPNAVNRATWERYGQDQWQSIARSWGVTAVLTVSDWSLSLPIVERNPYFVLYGIPE